MDPDGRHLSVQGGADFLADRLVHVLDRAGVEVAGEQPVSQGAGEARLGLGRIHSLQPGLGLGRTLTKGEVGGGRHLDRSHRAAPRETRSQGDRMRRH